MSPYFPCLLILGFLSGEGVRAIAEDSPVPFIGGGIAGQSEPSNDFASRQGQVGETPTLQTSPTDSTVMELEGSASANTDIIRTSEATQTLTVKNDQLKIKDGFGAQFWITDNDTFHLNWCRPAARNLTSVSTTRRGVPLYIALFIMDPGHIRRERIDKVAPSNDNPNSFEAPPQREKSEKIRINSEVTYDYEVLKPDGGIFATQRNVTAWNGRAPGPGLITLAHGRSKTTLGTETSLNGNAIGAGSRGASDLCKLEFQVIDPPGDYTINLVIHDLIKKVDIALHRKLTLRE